MKVRIVDKKEEKVMTIEELASKQYIGLSIDHSKYFCTSIPTGYSFVRPMARCGYPLEKFLCLEAASNSKNGHLHVFDTDKELLLWMIE